MTEVPVDGQSASPTGRLRTVIPYLLLFFLVLLVYGVSPVVMNGDSFLLAPTTAAVLDGDGLRITEFLGPATDGGLAWVQSDSGDGRVVAGSELPPSVPAGTEVYNYFPWPQALLAVPFAFVFKFGEFVTGGAVSFDGLVAAGNTGAFNLIGAATSTAVTVVLLTAIVEVLLRARAVAGARRLALLSGLVIAFGTPAWSTLSRALWSQTTSTMLTSGAVLMAVLLAIRPGRQHPWLAYGLGLLSFLAYASRPTAVIGMCALGIWFLVTFRRQWFTLVTGLAGLLTVAIPWVLVNVTTFGTLQPPYYNADRVGFAGTTVEAILGNLISPNRGLFVFSSIALLSIWGAVRAIRRPELLPRGLVWVAVTVSVLHLVAVSGSSEGWWAGSAIGPRFMADLLPYLVLLAVPAVEKLATGTTKPVRIGVLALCIVSVLVNGLTATSRPAACWNLDPVSVDEDPARVWDWSDWQVARPLRALGETGSVVEAFIRPCAALTAE